MTGLGGKMKACMFAITVVLMALACTTTVYCEEGIEPGMMDQSLRVFDGKVAAVDPAAGTLSIEGSIDMVFKISPDTVLKNNEYDVELADIKMGSYVTVECRRTAETFKVLKVTVKYPYE